MWPGANLPMGPPPVGPTGSTGPPPPIKPAAGWYALPITLAALAILVFFVPLAFLWSDSEAADGPTAKGDPASGVKVQLVEDHGYFVYVRPGGEPPSGCRLETGGAPYVVAFSHGDEWIATSYDSWKYVATFRSPMTGSAQLHCRSGADAVMVEPDDSSYFYLGLTMMAAAGLGIVAIAALPVIMLRRSSSRRRAAAVMGPPYGY